MEAKGYKTLAYLCESRRTYDFEIKVGNRSFPSVRSVLENKSEYFRALFSSGMKEVEEGVLNMFGVEADGVEQCMSFLHSGRVVLHSQNIFGTLTAAHLLQLESVTSICFQVLHENLNLNNYLTALRVCDLYENTTAKNRVRTFIARHLPLLANTEKFLTINMDDFVYCLGLMRQNKHVNSIWKIAAKWIQKEPTRQRFLKDIIQHIPMQLASEEYFLDTILKEPFVKMSPESRNTVIEEWFSHSAVRKNILAKGFYCWRSKLQNLGVDNSKRAWEHMLKCLGENITDLSQQDGFVALDEWSILSVFQSKTTKFSSERAKWRAAVKWIGGEKNRIALFPQLFNTIKFERVPPSFMRENIESFPLVNDFAECLEALKTFKARKEQPTVAGLACVYQYGPNIVVLSLNTKHWSNLANCESGDEIVGMVSIRGDIYLMGCKSLHRFSGNSTWTKLAGPPTVESSSKAVTFRNRIYLFSTCGISVHFYDLCDNTWTKGSEMKRWWMVCATSSENFIWLVGNYCQAAAKYDPINDSWSDIATPIHSQTYAAAAVLYEKLYLVGGETWSRSAECYDPDTNTWTEISDLIQFPRSYLSLCVINNELYAVGPTERGLHDSVDVYDAERDEWRFVRNLPRGRGHVHCCWTMGTFISRDTTCRYTTDSTS